MKLREKSLRRIKMAPETHVQVRILARAEIPFRLHGIFSDFSARQTKNHSPVWKNRSRGLFLERPGKLSGAVSHPVSRRKPFWVFLVAPVIFDPVIIPISNIPGNYRESLRVLPETLPRAQ